MTDWLADPEHPALSSPAAERLNDASRPDRLTWNAFRTLALWNTDVWVPSLLEGAIGDDNELSGLEWSGASVELWLTHVTLDDATDVVIDGPEALVVVLATLNDDLPVAHVYDGLEHAMQATRGDTRRGAFVLVAPSDEGGAVQHLVQLAGGDRPLGGEADRVGLREEDIPGSVGWMTWRDVGRLALDLAEEADPLRGESVHNLVSQLQARFPGIEF